MSIEASKTGYCYGVEDGLDGYCVHAPGCPSFGEAWSGPNSTCIKYDPYNPKHARGWICTCGHPGAGCYCP